MMKKFLLLVILVSIIGISFSYTGLVVSGSETNYQVHTSIVASTDNLYLDTSPDLFLVLLNSGSPVPNKYVALFYAIDVNGNWIGYSITKDTHAHQVLALTDSNGANQNVNLIDTALSDPVTNYPAEVPGRPLFFISDSYDNNAPVGGTLIIPNKGEGFTLKGSYSHNDFVHTYNPKTGDIKLYVSNIIVDKASSSVGFDYGVGGGSPVLIVGTCEDNHGFTCHDGANVTPNYAKENGVVLNTGYGNNVITDEHPHIMNLIINGFAYTLPLGADLRVTKIDTPSLIYYTQSFKVNVTVENYGNVNITHPFNLSLTITNEVGGTSFKSLVLSKEVKVNGNPISSNNPLKPLSKTYVVFNVEALSNGDNPFSYAPSQLKLVALADSANVINETYENNNNLTTLVTFKPVYNLTAYINGVMSWHFNYSGIPYNVTFKVLEEPGNSPVNVNLLLSKVGGANLFAPLAKVTSYFKVSTPNGVYSTVLIPMNNTNNPEVICVSIPGQKLVDPSGSGSIVSQVCFNETAKYDVSMSNTQFSSSTKDMLSYIFTYVEEAYLSVYRVVIGS